MGIPGKKIEKNYQNTMLWCITFSLSDKETFFFFPTHSIGIFAFHAMED